jgi:tetratricopeptide (TPR) repeat protein
MSSQRPETAVLGTGPAAIANLNETERRALSYAAAMGKEFDFTVLAAAVEMEEEPLAEILETLVHNGILKEVKGGDAYAFSREEIMVQAYRDISSSRVRVIHRKIAEAYEKLNPEPSAAVVPEMGRHFHLGQVRDKSLLYNRYAASLATKAFSPDVAIQYLERVLEDFPALTGDHRLEEADVLRELGDACFTMGETKRADEYYARSIEKIPQEEALLRSLVLLSRADTNREMDSLVLSRQYCGEAIALLEKLDHKKGLAMAHRILSRVAHKEGDFERGRSEIEATLALLDEEKDARDIARCYIELGNAYGGMDNPVDQALSIEYYKKAIRALATVRDYHELSRAHNNLAITLGLDKPREALRELKEAQNCAERGKDKRMSGWALFNSVEYHLVLGEYEEAVRCNDEARSVLSKLNDPMALQQVAMNDGIIAHTRKSYEDAEKGYREALRRAEGLGYGNIILEMHLRLASLFADWGRMEESRREYAEMEKVGLDKLLPQNKSLFEALKARYASG